jgi:hypothetical protein
VHLDPVDADVLTLEAVSLLGVARDGARLGDVEAAVVVVDPEQRQLLIEIDLRGATDRGDRGVLDADVSQRSSRVSPAACHQLGQLPRRAVRRLSEQDREIREAAVDVHRDPRAGIPDDLFDQDRGAPHPVTGRRGAQFPNIGL